MKCGIYIKKNEGGVGLSQVDILTITNGEYLK